MRIALKWNSIRFKLTVTFLIILLPLVMASLFTNVYSQRMLYEQIKDRTRGALLTSLEYVDQLTKNMDQQTLLISSNPNLVDVWQGIEDPLSRENLYDVHVVQQQLSTLISINHLVKEAFIVHGKSGNGVSTLKGGIKWSTVNQEKWFQDTVGAGGGLIVHIPDDQDLLKQNDSIYLNNESIYYARLLDVFNLNSEPNVLVLEVEKSSLRTVVQHLQTSEHTDISLSFHDQFVLASNPSVTSKEDMFRMEESNGVWSIVMEQPQAELFQQPSRLEKMNYFFILISVVLAIWIAWLVNSEISNPLKQLFGAIKHFTGGHLSTVIKHRRKDEFGLLMNAFNKMAEAQRRLIEEDYEKELKLARSEFSLLQSQINPHFLYNTLDSIYSVAMKHQIEEIGEMVINLAHFFRSNLGKGKETFTLEETIHHLMFYIRVQQLRTDDFSVEIDISEDTKHISILKLLLQPLVENAIIHGIGRSPYGGELYISSKLVDKTLHITIEDTGYGIEQQELDDIQEELRKINIHSYRDVQGKENSRYFGLKNVKSRLKLYYGNESELHIDLRAQGGTRAIVIIPVEEDKSA